MRKIILHIGMPKTGSSAIQAFMALNHHLLVKQGINYPDPLPFTQPYQTSSGNGVQLREMIGRSDFLSVNKYLKKICSVSLLNVFSSEAFYDEFVSRQENFFNAFKEYNIQIVIYVRRHDYYIQSAFNQGVKNHGFYSLNCLDALIKNADFATPLINSLKYIDKSKVTVRPYETGQFVNGTIYHDFISTLGIEWNESFQLPGKFVNPSLSYDALKFRIFLNEIGIDSANWSEKVTWNRYLQNYSVHQMGNNTFVPYSILNHEKRMEIVQKFTPTNAIIAATFINKNAHTLFEEKITKECFTEHNTIDLNAIDFKSIIHFIYAKNAMIIHSLSSFLNVDRGYTDYVKQKIVECQQAIHLEMKLSGNIRSLIHSNSNFLLNKRLFINSKKKIEAHNFQKEVLFIHPAIQLKHSDDALIHLVLTEANSFFVLKSMPVLKNMKEIKIALDMVSPEKTFLKIFYQTYNEPWDSEEKSVYYPIEKGKNIIEVIIQEDFLNGRLRIDPGKIKGEYLIKQIQIEYRSDNQLHLFKPRFIIRLINYLKEKTHSHFRSF